VIHPGQPAWTRRAVALTLLGVLLAGCAPSSDSPAPSASTNQAASAAPASAAVAPACDTASSSPGTEAGAPWWRDRVFYEVFVRSFADSDGDGIGDLRGLTERLDYLNDGDPATTDDLGVTALWLMPVAESPSYHGYDVTDYQAIEADYGTADDFRALMAAAHQRGIDVIVDLVLNHTSVEHPWFQDARVPGSPHDDWYLWSAVDPGISGPGGTEVWHRDGDRWYYGYFWEGMPDLDLENPAVSAALDDVASFWLQDLGVDGFRLDAAKHLIEDGATLENTPATKAWLQGFRSRVHAADPEALLVGEVWDATSVSSEYVQDGALDMTFAFGLAGATISGVRFGDPASLAVAQAEVDEAYPQGGYASFLTNHDQDRSFDQLGRDIPSAKAAATLLLTGNGVPFVYYGEEIGMRGRKPDERIRTPLAWTGTPDGYGFTTGTPWEAMAEGVETANIATETTDRTSLLARYRDLIALRAAHPALRRGDLIPLESSVPGVYAYLRHDATETVAVVVNLSKEPVADVSLGLAAGPLCSILPAATALLSDGDAGDIEPPAVNAAGGFDTWAIGSLGARESLIVAIEPAAP
jgi:glycosidase